MGVCVWEHGPLSVLRASCRASEKEKQWRLDSVSTSIGRLGGGEIKAAVFCGHDSRWLFFMFNGQRLDVVKNLEVLIAPWLTLVSLSAGNLSFKVEFGGRRTWSHLSCLCMLVSKVNNDKAFAFYSLENAKMSPPSLALFHWILLGHFCLCFQGSRGQCIFSGWFGATAELQH